MRGLILPPVTKHISFANSSPDAVAIANAKKPSMMIRKVSMRRKFSALAVAPTVTPRNIVMAFIRPF